MPQRYIYIYISSTCHAKGFYCANSPTVRVQHALNVDFTINWLINCFTQLSCLNINILVSQPIHLTPEKQWHIWNRINDSIMTTEHGSTAMWRQERCARSEALTQQGVNAKWAKLPSRGSSWMTTTQLCWRPRSAHAVQAGVSPCNHWHHRSHTQLPYRQDRYSDPSQHTFSL